MFQLLGNHLLQFIFIKNFYDENRHVNTKNKWVWGIHALNYPYIMYVFYFTEAAAIDETLSSKIWIPLDCLLTINIALYQVYYHYSERKEAEKVKCECEED